MTAPDTRTEYIELADRVFAITITPATAPGRLRRSCTVTVESGPGLTVEEARSILSSVVADLASQGIDVTGWGYEEQE